MLASLVIDYLRSAKQNDSTIGVAGVYCNFREPKKIPDIMGSLLRQLAEPLHVTPQLGHEQNSLSKETMSRALPGVLLNYEHVYVVIDALDECPHRLALLEALQSTFMSIPRKSARS